MLKNINSSALVPEYCHCLKPGGRIYTITDVKELFEWTNRHFEDNSQLRRFGDEEMDDDPFVSAMTTGTDEARRVDSRGGEKFYSVFVKELASA